MSENRESEAIVREIFRRTDRKSSNREKIRVFLKGRRESIATG